MQSNYRHTLKNSSTYTAAKLVENQIGKMIKRILTSFDFLLSEFQMPETD